MSCLNGQIPRIRIEIVCSASSFGHTPPCLNGQIPRIRIEIPCICSDIPPRPHSLNGQIPRIRIEIIIHHFNGVNYHCLSQWADS